MVIFGFFPSSFPFLSSPSPLSEEEEKENTIFQQNFLFLRGQCLLGQEQGLLVLLILLLRIVRGCGALWPFFFLWGREGKGKEK